MATKDQVINVSMTLNTKGFTDGLTLSDKQAKALGKSIASALTIDSKSAVSSVKAVNDALASLPKIARGARDAIKDVMSVSVKGTNSNIQSVAKELGILKTKADTTATALKNVKFLIGDSNANIKSVITQLERLETVAKRVGAVKAGTTTSTATGKSTVATGTAATTAAQTPPTFNKNNSEYTGPYMTPEIRKKNEQEYQDMLDRRAKSQFEADKKIVDSQKTMSAESAATIKKQLESIPSAIDSVGKQSQGAFSKYFSASFFGNLLANSLFESIGKLKDLGEQTVLYAARTQELGVVLDSLAKVHNINTQEITNQEQAIKRLNITTQDARETLAKFINVGFDVKSAGPLARVAQDLAVIGNKNTSDELNQLVVAIQTLQSRNLRNAGVFLTVDEVLDKLSATTGRARDSFSTLEKQQAVLNAVMEYGGRVAGTYQAAMGTTAKQLRSLDRQFKEAQNAIGEDFVGSLGLAVQASSYLLQGIARFPDIFADAAVSIGLFTVSLIAMNTQLIQGAYSGIANTISSFTNQKGALAARQELEAAITLEKESQLAVERVNLQISGATVAELLNQLKTEGAINAELATQIGLRGTTLEQQTAELRVLESNNAAALRRNVTEEGKLATSGNANSVAGVVGQVAGVLAIVAVVATLGKLAYDLATGPYAVGTLDINAIANEAEKTKDLEKLKSDLINHQVDLKTADLEISKRITDERLVDYRTAQAQTSELEKQQKLILTIDAQIQANQIRRVANQISAGQNIFEAAANLTSAQTTATAQAGAVNGTNKTLGIATRNIGTFTKAGLARLSGSSIENVNLGIRSGLSATYQDDLKEEEKAQSVLNDSISQAQKVAQAYGVSLQSIIDKRLDLVQDKTSDSYKTLVVNIKKAVDALNEQEDATLRLQALSPEEKTTGLITEFEKKRADSIEKVRAEVVSNINQFVSDPKRTSDDLQKYGQSQIQYLQRTISLIDQNFGTNKGNFSSFVGNIGQKLSDIEQQKGPLSLEEKIKAINEQVAIARKQDPVYIKDLFDVGQSFTANTKFVDSYLGAHQKLNDELRISTAELQGFVSQNAADRKLGFQIEANKKLLSTVQDISRLEFELNKQPTNLRRFGNNIDAAKAYEKSLQRQLKFHDDMLAALEAQQTAEDEITELKLKVTIPAVSAELLAEKEILETIIKRKETEQQLTADIAVEIDKRTRYALDSARETNRLSAEVFLDRQKTERQTQEDAIKNVLGLALQNGNDKAFTDNPLIKEAVKQSENLANLEKQGGVQGQKLTVINDTALETNKKLETINSTLVTKLQAIIDKPSGGFSTDTLSGGYGTSSVGGNVKQRFNAAYNRFASAGVNPNEAKFYAAISAAEGGGDVMYGGNTYNPRDPRHPGTYLQGKMGPAGISYAAGPLQITRENWLKYGGGDFSNMANHVRIAEILSGRGAVQAARSGDFARAFALGGGNAWAAIPGSNLPGRKQSVSLIASLLGTNLASPTQSVVSKIQATPAVTRGKGSWQAVAERYGLSAEEVGQILANAPKTAKGLAEIGETAFATAGLFKQFGGNAFATGVEATAIGNTAKDIKDRTEAVNISAAMRNVTTFNQVSLAALNNAEAWEKYHTEVNTENNFGTSNRATSDAIERSRLKSLRTRGATFYNQAYGEASSKRIADQVSLEKELIGLEEEGDYRTTRRLDYRQNQAKLFYKEQLTQSYALDDANSQLFERENAYLDTNSQLRKNILAQELQERKAAKQTLTEEIDAITRYNTEYLNSAENRQRIEREAQRDRLKEHQDTVNQILRLEEDLTHVQENLSDRLRLKQAQINVDRAKEYEDTLTRQLQAENDFKRKSDPFNRDEFRTRGLDKINSEMKDSTTLMSDLFSDSFDAISGGFGGLIDKMTAKMGIFGGAIGNFLKGTINNVLGRLSKSVLDIFFPQNGSVTDVLGGATGGTPSILGNILGGTKGSGVTDSFAQASDAAIGLANAFGQAASVILQTAGITGSSALAASGLVSSGISLATRGFTGRGTSFGGGSAAGAGGGILSQIFNSIGSVNSITSSGAASIGNTLGSLSGHASPNANDGSQEYGHPFPTSGGVGQATSGVLGGLLKNLNLKGIGTSFFQAAPALGAGLGGLLGGPSTIGQGLGTIGGGLLGILGGAAGLSVLGGTGLTGGAIGSISGFLGISGAATLGIGAAIGGAFLLASYLFGRAKRRKQEAAKVTQLSGDALQQLQDLLKAVKTDKVDGEDAISQAQAIRDEYVKQISTLTTKPGKRDAQVQLQAMDSVIAQIGIEAQNQKIRKELDSKIVPTYASGGRTTSNLIRVSPGETMFIPTSAGSYSGADLAAAGIPNFSGGGAYVGAKIRGNFDGRDNILTRVPRGTVIANPRQMSKIRQAPRFASGGVSNNYGSFTAQGNIVVQPPPVTAIIVFTPDEAEALGRQIPGAVIVGKVRRHVKDTGTTGLAGDIVNQFRG